MSNMRRNNNREEETHLMANEETLDEGRGVLLPLQDDLPNPANTNRDGKRGSFKLIACFALAFAVMASVVLTIVVVHRAKSKAHHLTSNEPQAQTNCGLVEGNIDGSSEVMIFKGIPYAVPPTGALRWKPPIDLKTAKKCWHGVLKAKEFASSCPQKHGQHIFGSEDCLYLNVLTPTLNSNAKLPVLFWIHGGYLTAGSGSDIGLKGYFPNAKFVKKMNIVAVTINYRLNAFGFLTLKVLSEASTTKTSGNYGFMDQILALKWVQENIANFGGDKERVTVLGQSSGGTSIYGLLAAESARGLFATAISQSGSPVFNKTSKEAAKDNLIFIKNSKCVRSTSIKTLKCLYQLSISQILHAIPWSVYPSWAMRDLTDFPTFGKFDGALAVVDGDVIKYPPGELHLHPDSSRKKVTIVIGTTAQEIGISPVQDFTKKPYKAFVTFVKGRLRKFLSTKDIHKALSLYAKMKQPVGSRAQYIYETMSSDVRAGCTNDLLTANFSRSKNHVVYRYVATSIPSGTVPVGRHRPRFAFHLWDTFALYGVDNVKGFTPKKSDKKFMRLIQTQFKHLFHYGHPRTTDWRRYPLTTALFGTNRLHFVGKHGYHAKQCKFWNEHGFFSYGWIN